VSVELPCRSDWYCLMTQWSNPSQYLRFMRDEGRLPQELAALNGVQQNPKNHPEGCALSHTFCVVDAAADIMSREGIVADRRVMFLMAALCHDMGKAVSTFFHPEKQKWVAYGHDVEGVPIALRFLESIQATDWLKDRVLLLVRYHMTHIRLEFTPKAVRKIARVIQPLTIADLVLMMEADCAGRPPIPSGLPAAVREQLIPIATENGWMNECHRADRLKSVEAA
jgi:tRNA nucleotidyltransferase (CCA-adding enzyme)